MGKLQLEPLEDRLLLSADFGFAAQLGASNLDDGKAVAADAGGNVYVTGSQLLGFGGETAFVAKYSPAGDLLWSHFLRETTWPAISEGHGIAVRAGHVYVTGNLSGEVDFDPDPMRTDIVGTAPNCCGGNYVAAFVWKLSDQGEHRWARTLGGLWDAQAEGKAVAIDLGGNVVTTGKFIGIVDFDPAPGEENDHYMYSAPWGDPSGNWDAYVWRLDSDGDFHGYAKRFGGDGNDVGYGIATDSALGVYVTGSFEGTGDFDPATNTLSGGGQALLTSSGPSDGFVVRLDFAGNLSYANRLGGTGNDQGRGITADPDGVAYVTGFVEGAADVTTSGLQYLGFFDNPHSGRDAFVLGLEPNGLSRFLGRMGGDGDDEGGGVVFGDLGQVYLTGHFEGLADLDPSAMEFGVSNNSPGNRDVFVVRISHDHELTFALHMGGPDADQGNGIAVARGGYIYTTGTFEDTADFDPGRDPGQVFSLAVQGRTDVFVSQLVEDAAVTYYLTSGEAGNDLTLRQSGTYLELVDNVSGRLLMRRPLARTQGVQIVGVNFVSDTLTIDYTGGEFWLADGVVFEGGAGGTDRLILRGTSQYVYEIYDMTGADSGSITLRNVGRWHVQPAISFTGIEAVDDTFTLASSPGTPTLEFNASNAGGDVMTLAVGAMVNGVPTTQLSSSGGTFPTLRFASRPAVLINGRAGNDSLTVDFLGGNPLASSGLAFDGGAGTANRLLLRNNTFTTATYTPTSAVAGNIALRSGFFGVSYIITYDRISSIEDTGAAASGPFAFATNLIFNATNALDNISVLNGGVRSSFQTTQISGLGTFATLYFANRTSVRINTLDQADLITVNNPNRAAGMHSLRIDGGNQDDTLTIDFAFGSSIPSNGLTFDGGSGTNNRLILQHNVFSNDTYTATGPTAGSIALRSIATPTYTINYTNVHNIDDTGPAPIFANNLTFHATTGADVISIVNGLVIGGLQTMRISSAGSFTTVNFANRSSVTINGRDGNDSFSLNNPTRAAGLNALTLDGGNNDDTFTMATPPANVTLTVRGQTGDNDLLSYATYTAAVTVDLTAGTATGIGGGVSGIEHVTGGAGGDFLTGNGVTNILRGGRGRDRLWGMGGNDILLGGMDDDPWLDGGDGMDLIIGGSGFDVLLGGPDSSGDLLIGGEIDFQGNSLHLRAILAEWTRTDLDPATSYADRTDHLRNGGGLNGTTVLLGNIIEDNAMDQLRGGDGDDWYWTGLGDTASQVVGRESIN